MRHTGGKCTEDAHKSDKTTTKHHAVQASAVVV
jgi:hypothetical protein